MGGEQSKEREWWGKPGWTGSQGESLGEDIRAERPAMEEQRRGCKAAEGLVRERGDRVADAQ